MASPAVSPSESRSSLRSSLRSVRRYLRQIVAELRKVIWPTRAELLRSTIVVLLVVIVSATVVGLLDFGFGKLMFTVFGGGS